MLEQLKIRKRLYYRWRSIKSYFDVVLTEPELRKEGALRKAWKALNDDDKIQIQLDMRYYRDLMYYKYDSYLFEAPEEMTLSKYQYRKLESEKAEIEEQKRRRGCHGGGYLSFSHLPPLLERHAQLKQSYIRCLEKQAFYLYGHGDAVELQIREFFDTYFRTDEPVMKYLGITTAADIPKKIQRYE